MIESKVTVTGPLKVKNEHFVGGGAGSAHTQLRHLGKCSVA